MFPPTVHKVSMNLLNKWTALRGLDEDGLNHIKSFHSFHTPSHNGCSGGAGMIVITMDDQVYGIGHNCADINILGFQRTDPAYRQEHVPELTSLPALCDKRILQLSVGGLVGAAVSDTGALYWWGNCDHRSGGGLMEPQCLKSNTRPYCRVSCGHRMMAALTFSGRVYVWGQVHDASEFVVGMLVIVGSQISEISCGRHHLGMMDTNGHVFTWGRGAEGQRGFAGYNNDDQYKVTKIMEEPCSDVKCGPYATFCLTRNSRELMGCGINCHLSLGLIRRHPVTTPTAIFLDGAVTDFFVVGTSDDTALMAAYTSDGECFTWGTADTPYPKLADAASFMEIFTLWNLTPGLTFIRIRTNAPVKQAPVLPNKSALMSDDFVYIHRRNRPERARESAFFQWASNNRRLGQFVNQITSEESGRAFILQKYVLDVQSEPHLP